MSGRPRRIVPATLTGRLVLTAVGLVAVIGFLVSVTTTLAMRHYLTGQLDGQVRQGAERATRMLLGPGHDDRDGDDGPSPQFGLGDQVDALTAVVTASGATTGGLLTPTQDGPASLSALSTGAKKELASLTPGNQVRSVDLGAEGRYRLIARDYTVNGQKVTLVSGLPTDAVDSAVTSIMWWQLLLTLAGVGIAALVGERLVRRTLTPLRQVAATAHDVTELPLDQGSVGETARVPEELTDPATEVGQVGAALNKMLGHVESALDARHQSELQVRQFVADASHELRTPLATIMGYAELARRSPSYDAGQALTKVEEEGVRMSALVEDLLLLARLDSGRPLAEDEVDLTKLALEAVEAARVVSRDHRWLLDLPDEPVSVRGDEQRLHQVLTNLLANAGRHTPAGTTVTIGLRPTASGAEVTVSDDGPGVPEELQATIFERFTRGDSSRTRDSGGAGLGLALVQAIVAAHDGTVGLESHPGSTRFTVTLPA